MKISIVIFSLISLYTLTAEASCKKLMGKNSEVTGEVREYEKIAFKANLPVIPDPRSYSGFPIPMYFNEFRIVKQGDLEIPMVVFNQGRKISIFEVQKEGDQLQLVLHSAIQIPVNPIDVEEINLDENGILTVNEHRRGIFVYDTFKNELLEQYLPPWYDSVLLSDHRIAYCAEGGMYGCTVEVHRAFSPQLQLTQLSGQAATSSPLFKIPVKLDQAGEGRSVLAMVENKVKNELMVAYRGDGSQGPIREFDEIFFYDLTTGKPSRKSIPYRLTESEKDRGTATRYQESQFSKNGNIFYAVPEMQGLKFSQVKKIDLRTGKMSFSGALTVKSVDENLGVIDLPLKRFKSRLDPKTQKMMFYTKNATYRLDDWVSGKLTTVSSAGLEDQSVFGEDATGVGYDNNFVRNQALVIRQHDQRRNVGTWSLEWWKEIP